MRLRRRLLVPALLLTTVAVLGAQATRRAAPSTRATTTVSLVYPRDSAPPGAGPASITINYGQPHLRGRKLYTDSLVPWGQPWRTGANEATMLMTDVDLTLGGKAVPKGNYVVWTLPTRQGWTMILLPDTATVPPASVRYAQRPDEIRIPLRSRAIEWPVESLSFWLIPDAGNGPPKGKLWMSWGTTLLAADWAAR
jgi:hypothetical protein